MSTRAGQPDGRRDAWLALALVAAIFFVYQPAWRAGFIWDDDAHLTAHKCIVGPLGFAEIWTTAEANYFPLVLTTFWVVNKIAGLNPVVFHLLGIALHAASALLLWAVLRRLLVRGAWLGATLWAFHPVQVKSVAWVSEIINTQSAGFFLAAIWFALGWVEQRPRARRDYALACVCALAAMLSKPSTVMLPIALALCFWWRRGALRGREMAGLAPFFLMAAAAGGWAIWEQRVHQSASGADWSQTPLERLIIAGRAVIFYLGKLFWPHPLSFIYPRWTLEAARVWSFGPGLLVLGAGATLWWRRATWRPVAFAAAYFVALLFPVLGFFNVYFFRYSFVADHFQYLASIGPLVLAGAGMATLLARANASLPNAGLRALVAGVLLTLAGSTWAQARNYRDDETIWRTTLRTNPDSFLAHNNLGVILLDAGRFPEASEHLAVAARLRPDLPESHLNLGRALASMPDRTDAAIAALEAARRLRPDEPLVHLAFGNLYAVTPGRREDALRHFAEVLRREPSNWEAQIKTAALLETDPARRDEAIAHYQAALQARPDYAKAHRNLAGLLARDPARRDDAMRHFERALALEPDSAVTHNNFAIVLAEGGHLDDAQRHFERALQINPAYTDARNNLARLKTLRGN